MNLDFAPLVLAAALLPGIAAARSDFHESDSLTFVADSSSCTVKFSWVDAVIRTTTDKSLDLDGFYTWSLFDATAGAILAGDNDVPDSVSGDYAKVTRGSFLETFSSLTAGHTYNLTFHGEWNLVDGWIATAREPSVSLAIAVPEPETYAMMLAGLGLVGFVSRRRRNSR